MLRPTSARSAPNTSRQTRWLSTTADAPSHQRAVVPEPVPPAEVAKPSVGRPAVRPGLRVPEGAAEQGADAQDLEEVPGDRLRAQKPGLAVAGHRELRS